MENKNKVYLIYNLFFDLNKNQPSIGGIQTYICDLAEVFIELNYDVVIVQSGLFDTTIDWNGYKIKTIKCLSNKTNSYKRKISSFVKNTVKDNDFVVFMTHTLNCKVKHKNVISIQHGIYWDIPSSKPKSTSLVEFLFRNYRAYADLKNVNKCKNCVAVDYNFLNWYKTQQYFRRVNINVIPNYASVYDRKKNSGKNIKILFARRFEEYRGTRIFAESAKKLLNKYDNLEITFAGDGLDKDYLSNLFKDNQRVHFIRYNYGESSTVHMQHDIAVVSSIGSEGTSLSLLEAMGTGCAVVSTNVGGLTNIVINEFNGMISDINSESLYFCLEKLIVDSELRNRVANNAYDTVKYAFSKEKWKERWKVVIENISSYETTK